MYRRTILYVDSSGLLMHTPIPNPEFAEIMQPTLHIQIIHKSPTLAINVVGTKSISPKLPYPARFCDKSDKEESI